MALVGDVPTCDVSEKAQEKISFSENLQELVLFFFGKGGTMLPSRELTYPPKMAF